MADRTNQYRERIPEYLAGQLDQEETAAMDRLIHDDPELAGELDTFIRIRDSYRDMAGTLPAPPSDAFLRIMAGVDEHETAGARTGTAVSDRSPAVRWLGFLKSWFTVPRAGWALAVIQAVIILVISVTVVTGPSKTEYQTLSAVPSPENAIIRLNVVFNETAMEKEIRTLLTGIPADIVSGPSLTGRYVLAISGKKDTAAVMEIMGQAGVVKFVQKSIESESSE